MTRLVLLHGFMGSPNDWDSIRDRLDCTTLAPPLPEANTWRDAVEMTAALLEPGDVLAGYSMGGRLALGVAVHTRTPIAGVILMSCSPGLPEAERAARREHDRMVADQLIREPLEDFLTNWYSQSVFEGVPDAMKQRMIDDKSTGHPARYARTLLSLSVAEQPDYTADLAQLDVPALIIAGELDPKYAALSESMSNLMPNAERLLVSQAGHVVHREQPDVVANAMQQFLTRVQ